MAFEANETNDNNHNNNDNDNSDNNNHKELAPSRTLRQRPPGLYYVYGYYCYYS